MYVHSIDAPLEERSTVALYGAEIVGPDPKWTLKRIFLPYRKTNANDRVSASFEVGDGVFEFGITVRDKASKKLISRKRQWVVVFEDDAYEFDDTECTASYALYALFNLRLQQGKSVSCVLRAG